MGFEYVYLSFILAIRAYMSDSGMSNVTLAEHMGVTEKIIRRLLDLDHVSRIDRLESALAYFDLQLELSIRPKPLVNQDVFRVQQ